MKVTSLGPAGEIRSGGQTQTQSAARLAASAASVVAPDQVHVGEQTEQVQAAQAAIAAMPEIDAQRVADIKAALARGEIAFDAQKIAGLVVRHHGGRG